MDNRLLRGKDKEARERFSAQFKDMKSFKEAFMKVWKDEYEASTARTEKREVFDSPNAFAQLAWELGYRAAKQECIKLMEEQKRA